MSMRRRLPDGRSLLFFGATRLRPLVFRAGAAEGFGAATISSPPSSLVAEDALRFTLPRFRGRNSRGGVADIVGFGRGV